MMWAARAVIWICAGADSREAVLGDLEEECAAIGAGGWRSRWWYARQAVCSAVPLLAMRWRKADGGALLAATGLVALAVAALERLWTFVLAQVPLRTGAERSGWMIAGSLGLAFAGALAAGAWLGQATGRWKGAVLVGLALGAVSGPAIGVAAALGFASGACLERNQKGACAS